LINVIQFCFNIAQKTHALRGKHNIIEYNVRKEKFMQHVDTTNYRIWLTTKPLSNKPSCGMLYFKGHLDEKIQNVRFERAFTMLKNVQCVINQFLTNHLLFQ
jgi:hypothetical protein